MKEFYIPSLDGLRGIAFLLVFVAHSGLDNLVPGGFGVTVFFFLSGYLITTILRLEGEKTGTISLSKFYLRRAFRILPPLYVTLALGYALGAFGLLIDRGNGFGLVAVSTYIYNYTDLLHQPAIVPTGTGVVWSLMVEEHFYFVFPLIYKAFVLRDNMPRRRQANLLLGLCALALLWRCCLVFGFHTPLTTLPRWTYSASDARFDAILFGCILAVRNNSWLGDPSSFLEKNKGWLALTGVATILITLVIREPHYRETLRYTVQSVALYPVFYYCVANSHAWPARWLEWTPLRWIGWVSYAMYLFHSIPLDIGYKWFHGHAVLVSLVSFVLTIVYAWAIRVFVEQPSRRLRSRLEHRTLQAIGT